MEIDAMESFEPGGVMPHNVFHGGYGQDIHRELRGIAKGLDSLMDLRRSY